MKKNCLQCNKEFKVWEAWVKRGEGKFCSRKCQGIFRSLNFKHSDYPELRLAIENGRTLCVQCHRNTDTYAGRIRKFQNV